MAHSRSDALKVMAMFGEMEFEVTPIADLLVDAFELAITHRRTVYDSLYLALSLRENCKFITADLRLVNAVSHAMPNVVYLHDWTPDSS